MCIWSGLNELETCPNSLLNVKKQFFNLLVPFIKIPFEYVIIQPIFMVSYPHLDKIKIFE